MPETLAVLPALDPDWAGRELGIRAAGIARRVAVVVEASCGPDTGAVDAVTFLTRWADSTAVQHDEAGRDDHPLDLLAARYGLSPLEVDVILLSGLPEQHEGLAATFRAFHPQGAPHPTVGLAALVFGDGADGRPMMRRMFAEGAAARGRLFALSGDGAFFEKSIVLADTLWDALHGYDTRPADLHRIDVDPGPVGLEQWVTGLDQRRAIRALELHEAVTVAVCSPDERVAVQRCAVLAAHAGAMLVAARCAPDHLEAVGALVALAAARGAIPVVVLASSVEPGVTLTLSLDDLPPPIMVCAPPSGVHIGARRGVLTVPTGPVAVSDHRAAWQATLPELGDQSARLATRHPIDPAIHSEVATDARLYERLGLHQVGLAEVSAMIRSRASVALPSGVLMITPNVPWKRLVLPQDSVSQLTDAVARLELEPLVLDEWGLRDRARATRGVRLLFTGPPGTGKSLGAEVVASALLTDLLVVDVSQIVSKWLGETEKNVSAVIDAAERMQAVLFFDEADNLFAKRTEISDAHDRYANLETSYLLQRLDRFEGLVVLATNLRHNIDSAFLRRMDFVIDFALPDLDCRREMWGLHLPADVLATDVDLDILARMYPIPGGWIRNAAIAAAFLAAGAESGIHQDHLVAAVRREYLKAALPFPGEPPRRRDDQML